VFSMIYSKRAGISNNTLFYFVFPLFIFNIGPFLKSLVLELPSANVYTHSFNFPCALHYMTPTFTFVLLFTLALLKLVDWLSSRVTNEALG